MLDNVYNLVLKVFNLSETDINIEFLNTLVVFSLIVLVVIFMYKLFRWCLNV